MDGIYFWHDINLRAPYYTEFRIFMFHAGLWWTSRAQLIIQNN